MLGGTASPAHAGLATLASRLQRAVVQGNVVVVLVVDPVVELVVVTVG